MKYKEGKAPPHLDEFWREKLKCLELSVIMNTLISALHDFSLVFHSIYNFSSFIFIFDFQEMEGGG
jgi:hypothetical protein